MIGLNRCGVCWSLVFGFRGEGLGLGFGVQGVGFGHTEVSLRLVAGCSMDSQQWLMEPKWTQCSSGAPRLAQNP